MRPVRTILLFIPLVSALGQPKTYSVTGQLVFDNGVPVARAEVGLSTNGWDEVTEPAMSDGQGRFSFTGLGAGAFILSAQRHDLGMVHWGQTPQPGVVSAVILSETFPVRNVLFRIDRRGTIAGTVRDLSGTPMVNLQVTAARRSWSNGKAGMQMTGAGTTDDLGRFRIPLVERGKYRVCVGSPQASMPVMPVGHATFGQSSREVYGQTCLPLLMMTPGRIAEVDVVFSPQTPVSVSGTIVNLPEHQAASVELRSVDPSSGILGLSAQMSGEAHGFQFANVSPGQYWVMANLFSFGNGQTKQEQLSARVPLTVGFVDVGAVELTLTPLPEISVVIHSPPSAGEITVGLRDADNAMDGTIHAVKQQDGSMRIPVARAGRYWMVTRTELCPSSARFGKIDATRQAFPIKPGTKGTLEVTFTDRCGQVRVTVTDREGAPVAKARSLILLSGTPEDPGDMLVGTAGEDGSFEYSGLVPKAYSLWAWDAAEEWDGALEDLRAMVGRETVVEVRPGEKLSVKLPLLSASARDNK